MKLKNYFDEKACQDKASMSILNRLLAESRVNVNQEITLKGYGLTRLTALHKAMIRYGSNNPRMANVIKAFIANERFDVNQKGEFGRRCELIHTLVQKEGAQALRILKDIVNLPGIDPNVPDQYGNTPLHYIILKCLLQSYGSLSVLLNNSKVQLNQKNEHGHIPFDYLFFLATRDLSGMDSSSSLEEKRIAIEAIKAFLRQGRFIVNNKQAMLNTLNSSDISLECRIDRIKALYSIPNPRRIPDGINRFCSHY
ncbi:hypothetical protein [Cardinium endosymbiont of Sogatella furcifera]|uniref:hypothetical protein n=1 Tax=Cardinium endosymbiont of Sogatella furcifera TaxID=650378 RepID=UPI0013B3C130|nr:hypothetical protein [Cardinium endosymbiont of Sogatella furcifera]